MHEDEFVNDPPMHDYDGPDFDDEGDDIGDILSRAGVQHG